MKSLTSVDLCIIGGGSGGLSVAAGAARLGASVVLIEAAEMGGDCLNSGCVPSKALIASSRQAHGMRTVSGMGIASVRPRIDFSAVEAHIASVIGSIAPHDSMERFEALGVDVIRARARFVSPGEVSAGDQVVRARRFVVATGALPVVPSIPGLEDVRYYTNRDIFSLSERPRHLVILGAGPMGLELAQAYSRLGSKVTVLEPARPLAREDPQLAEVALAAIRNEGVDVLEGARVAKLGTVSEGEIEVFTELDGTFSASHLLIAAGRRANTASLGLEAAGIESWAGGIAVDSSLRSSNRRVYAIGDVIGGGQFTHVAGYQAGLVIRSALFGLPVKVATRHIPRVTYTDPELAQVGFTEQEARDRFGRSLEVVQFDYADNDRARTSGQTVGLIKLMVVRGRPVGVGIVGTQAGELIGLWSLAISAKLKIADVAGMVAPYPTLGELSKQAAGQFFAPKLFENGLVRRFVKVVQKFHR